MEHIGILGEVAKVVRQFATKDAPVSARDVATELPHRTESQVVSAMSRLKKHERTLAWCTIDVPRPGRPPAQHHAYWLDETPGYKNPLFGRSRLTNRAPRKRRTKQELNAAARTPTLSERRSSAALTVATSERLPAPAMHPAQAPAAPGAAVHIPFRGSVLVGTPRELRELYGTLHELFGA